MILFIAGYFFFLAKAKIPWDSTVADGEPHGLHAEIIFCI